MRLKKQREDQAGYRRSTIALSPVAVAIAERLQQRLQLPSREAVINAVLERIDSDIHDYYRNIAAVVNGEAEEIVTPDQQRELMRLMEAIFESAEKNQVVYF